MTLVLTPPHVTGIESTQNEFDRYQQEAFGDRSPSFFALELAGECGELCNLEKKAWRDPSAPLDLGAISSEAADVFIALMNFANARGIDLERAITEKLEVIERRRQEGKMPSGGRERP